MHPHPLSPTTHTLDMAQVAEIDEHLCGPGAPRVTAGELGLADRTVPADGDVVRVWIQGSPEFPYLFATVEASPSTVVHVPLHTPALVRLSHRLGLHHRWGV
jgi:hypothetical protein